MSDRTGLGIVDVAVLQTLDRIGATADSLYMKCAKAVVELDRVYGLTPDMGYEALCDMARPWLVPLRCVNFHGNFGSSDFPAAGPQYTEARLSPIGGLAVAAERGEAGAVPIGLINGNTHGGGRRPPFDPRRIVTALRRVLAEPRIGDDELADLVGAPVFPTGSEVDGDIGGLLAGESVTLQVTARLRPAERRPGWVADRLPPGVGCREVTEYVASAVNRRPWSADLPELDRRSRIPVSDIEDRSSGDETRLVFTAAEGADLDELRARLLDVHGLSVQVRAQLPAPLAEVLRGWVGAHAGDDLPDSLGRLEQLLD